MSTPCLGCVQTEGLSKSDQLLLQSVLKWYNEHPPRVSEFVRIVERNNGLSLRVIDWLVTNYSRTTPVIIEKDGLPKDLYRDYQKYLSAYNKKNMDPFARRRRISITVFGTKARKSTVGQLNFFRWFLTNDLEIFLRQNRQEVEEHMKNFSVARKQAGKKIGCSGGNVRSYSGKFRVDFT